MSGKRPETIRSSFHTGKFLPKVALETNFRMKLSSVKVA